MQFVNQDESRDVFQDTKVKRKNTFFPFSFSSKVMKEKGTTFDKTFCHVQYKKKKCIEKSSQVHLLIYHFFWEESSK